MLEKLAQKIADSTSKIIGYDVIITNENSIIIGASEKDRIGTFHEASVRVIKTLKPNHSLYFQNKKGTKPGIALPIEVAGKAIGAIGITGNRKDVEKFGMLVKKHAEIMLNEEIFLKSTLLREQAIQNLIQEISAFDPAKTDELVLIARGYELGYDLKPPHVAIAIDLFRFGKLTKDIYSQISENESAELSIQSIKVNVLSKIKHIFNKPNDISTPLGDDKFIVLHSLDYNFDENKVFEEIQQKSSRVMIELEKKGILATIGIGSLAKSISKISKSCRDAWQAIELGKKIKDKPMIFKINDFYIEDLISNVSKDACNRFINEALKNLQQEPDWLELTKTIRAWCEAGFSQVEASKTLYIHRNTLSHRLNKIDQISGMNSRNFKDALMLYLAVLMIDLSEESVKEPR